MKSKIIALGTAFLLSAMSLACPFTTVTATAADNAGKNESGQGFGQPGQNFSQEDYKLSHGTSEDIIEESELNNTPPSDYTINSEVQRESCEGAYMDYFPLEELQTVEIIIDETNLNYLLQNAADKPSVMTESVTIGDTTLGYAGLKTKGSYTLSHTYTDNPGSDRFSFTVNFGKYIKKKDYGQTQNFYGVKKISFNNFFFDKSMMKEYFSLKLMTEMGLPTPAYALSKLYINGEYYGVYFMVEAMEQSILERFYEEDKDAISDYLVKVEDTTLDYEELLEDDSPLYNGDVDTYEDVQNMLPTVMEWDRKLCALSNGTDFEGNSIDVNSKEYLDLLSQVIDIDEELRYFATHSFLVQLDDMFVEYHNFGLYVDTKGISQIIPWDYDLSFGCYFPSTFEATANFDIDTMFKAGNNKSAEEFYKDFPLFNVIFQNEELRDKYHQYMKDCSIIAEIGGTTTLGNTYDAGWFDSYIDILSDKLIEAAGEELSDSVYYLNFTVQPRDLKAAIPNLSSIIAKRAVGVYLQVEGIDSKVTGGESNLGALGNAMPGMSSSKGSLTAVDNDTGWFISAEYSEEGSAPKLTAALVTVDKENYEEINSRISAYLGNDAEYYIYSYKTNREADSDITLTASMPNGQNASNVKVYSVNGGEISELSVISVEGSRCSVIVPAAEYIILNPVTANALNSGIIRKILIISIISLLIIIIAGLIVYRKNKRLNV
ncbi:MAG: CotH kinase family protein [Butyrivibrio sp.]|nr:CotH kinase family protein [Butyrivibrio sp.]